MTKREVIEILKSLGELMDETLFKEETQAIEKAIKILEATPLE